jgi:hypothetical protein
MIIHEPEIRLENGEVLLSARVETHNHPGELPETVWYAYPDRYQDLVSLRSDAFLIALAPIAQVLGENLRIRGEVSPRLLYGVNECQQVFQGWAPAVFKHAEINADKISHAPPPLVKDQHASLFSGGVDSFFTLYQGLFPEPGLAIMPLTHGLFMQGSPDIPLAYPDKYRILSERYARLYAGLGLELITARTNLMQFSAHRIPFVLFLEAPTISCALALSPLLSGLLVPAGDGYRHYRGVSNGPLTPQYYCTETFRAKSAGGASLRLHKVAALSHWEPAQKNLRVCFGFMSKGKTANCSRCSKCMRTRMDLHILGRLEVMETFERSFGLRDYLRWGRWLETGHGWQEDIWNYCRKNRPAVLPSVALGLLLGYLRIFLKRILPERIKNWVFRYTAAADPHIMYEAGQPVVPTAHLEDQDS